jgi:glutaconate CoA-transferase subunit B
MSTTVAPLKAEELLIETVRRLLAGARHVAAGANSPIPLAAALLEQRRDKTMIVSLQQTPEHNLFTDGSRELFDAAGQGRIDVFFFSGAEIDGQGNINLVAIGDYVRPKARFAGSYGSAFLYFAVPRIILFRTEHSRRTLVDKVSFVSAPGTSPPGVWRRGGPVALVTPFCLFAFDRARAHFRLESLHPGHTVEEVRDNTGFSFDVAERVGATVPPDEATLAALRGPVARALAKAYPKFAADIFGIEEKVSA